MDEGRGIGLMTEEANENDGRRITIMEGRKGSNHICTKKKL
jgi:hypothetical protein